MFRGGGVQECVLALQAELISRGYEVLIVTPKPREYTELQTENMRFMGIAKDVKSPFHTTAQISVSPDMETIDQLLASEKFDILHFHEPWVPMLSRQLLGRSRAINVATFHATLPDGVMSRTIEKVITPYTRSILKYFDALTAVSDTASLYAHSITDKPIQIIPNGIALEKYQVANHEQRAKNPEPSRMILYIGRLERRKGVLYLIKAFQDLLKVDPDVRLVISGDGPDRPKLEFFVHENHIPNIAFLGFVDETTKLRLMYEASLFCSPALFGESFGIVLLEAMAAGLPILAGNNRGYCEVLKQRGALSIVNPKDTTEFARRLKLFLGDKELRSLWSKWADEYVKQFDYPKVVDQYEALYKNLLKTKS